MVFRTKQDYQSAVLTLCEPLKKYICDGNAGIKIGHTVTHYNEKTMGLETFSRPLWGLVPFFLGGGSSDLEAMYQEGLTNGTNPKHSAYWGTYYDSHQGFVEMAVIGLGLLLTPGKIWEPLSEEAKHNLNEWLLQINQRQISQNNWLFFRVLVNIGLRNVGARYSEEAIEKSLDTIESFYLGEGWYSDGKTSQRDYYVAFAMHFFGLIYAKTMKDRDPKRCRSYIERAKYFAEDFIYWFGENGEALPYGRSLTYRFGQCAFWSALAFADVEVFSWGIMKGIVNRHFRFWFDQPILDGEGKLTIGYTYPNLNMAEGYNAPGSPYWAFKSFLILGLADDHPFWTAEEEPLPKLKALSVQKHPNMLIQRLSKGDVVALTSGQYVSWEPVHAAEKYEKFAYSSYFGFNVPRSYYTLGQAAPDNMLAFVRDDMYFVRRKCDEVVIEENSIYSKWSPMAGIVVETVIEPCEEGHIRKHTIHSEVECTAVECGFSLPTPDPEGVTKIYEDNFVKLCHEQAQSSVTLKIGQGIPGSILCEANTNIIHPRVTMPYIQLSIPKGVTYIETYVIGKRN